MTSVVNFPTVPLSAEAAKSAVAAILAAVCPWVVLHVRRH